MISAHVAGTLAADPERRTSDKGTPWLRLKLRVPNGNEPALFVSIACFGPDLIERLGPASRFTLERMEGGNPWTSD